MQDLVRAAARYDARFCRLASPVRSSIHKAKPLATMALHRRFLCHIVRRPLQTPRISRQHDPPGSVYPL